MELKRVKAKDLFIAELRFFTSFHFVQNDRCAVCLNDDSLRVFVILSIAKDLFIAELRFFISFHFVQNDRCADYVILSAAKDLKNIMS